MFYNNVDWRFVYINHDLRIMAVKHITVHLICIYRTAIAGSVLDVASSVYNSIVLFAVLGVMANRSNTTMQDVVNSGIKGG